MLQRFVVDEDAADLLERGEDYWLTFGADGIAKRRGRGQ
jgi:hypothetical protein